VVYSFVLGAFGRVWVDVDGDYFERDEGLGMRNELDCRRQETRNVLKNYGK